jgi:hypothetical protein
MPDNVALGAGAIGPLDGIDPERQVVTAVDGPGVDDPLGQVMQVH